MEHGTIAFGIVSDDRAIQHVDVTLREDGSADGAVFNAALDELEAYFSRDADGHFYAHSESWNVVTRTFDETWLEAGDGWVAGHTWQPFLGFWADPSATTGETRSVGIAFCYFGAGSILFVGGRFCFDDALVAPAPEDIQPPSEPPSVPPTPGPVSDPVGFVNEMRREVDRLTPCVRNCPLPL